MAHTIDPALYTVIVVVDVDPDRIEPLQAHAARGIDLFRECAGFVGGALHIDTGRRRLVQYLQWTDEAAYVRCRDDPAWDDLDSTRQFIETVREGRATVDERGYTVVATSG